MSELSQVFLFSDKASGIFRELQNDIFALTLIAIIGIVLLYLGRKEKEAKLRNLYFRLTIPLLGGGLFFLVVNLILFFNASTQLNHFEEIYRNGDLEIVEGEVDVLSVQKYSGHEGGDIIQIGNAEFEINYYCGDVFYYCKSIEHGGVLTQGAYVKIYYTNKNTILRIDIAE